MTLELYRCDLKVAEMIVCRKDKLIKRAVGAVFFYLLRPALAQSILALTVIRVQ
jgi:hypothetical protein